MRAQTHRKDSRAILHVLGHNREEEEVRNTHTVVDKGMAHNYRRSRGVEQRQRRPAIENKVKHQGSSTNSSLNRNP